MASYIFSACRRLNRWSSRQCPLNCSAISSSLLWQRRSRSFARFRGSRSPAAMARRIAIPVAPSISETARCTRTFIWSRLFCIRRTQSPDSATRFALSRTSVRSMQTASFGRNDPLSRPQLCSRWIHSQSVGSVFLSRPGTRASCRVSTSRSSKPAPSRISCGAIQ